MLSVTFANFSGSFAVFEFVSDVDNEPHDVLRFPTGSTQNCEDVCERPIELLNEVGANNLLVLVPRDLSGDEEQFAVCIRNDTMRVATGRAERIGIDKSESQCEERLSDPR